MTQRHLVLAAVALAWAVRSVADVLLVILVSMSSVAVLLPVVDAMERSGWRRGLAVAVLVVGLVIVIGFVLVVLVQAINGTLDGFG
jgi:putative heme transporter